MSDPIYLDYNAPTPIDPAVVDAILPYLCDHFGNPSSDHSYGYRARTAVQMAREHLAVLLGAQPDEIIFTGGGSEANNLAIKGVAAALHARGNHLITSAIEHPAPKGIGALVVRRGVTLEPLIHGASHEHGLRAGTENVAFIVGLGQAAALAGERAKAA